MLTVLSCQVSKKCRSKEERLRILSDLFFADYSQQFIGFAKFELLKLNIFLRKRKQFILNEFSNKIKTYLDLLKNKLQNKIIIYIPFLNSNTNYLVRSKFGSFKTICGSKTFFRSILSVFKL